MRIPTRKTIARGEKKIVMIASTDHLSKRLVPLEERKVLMLDHPLDLQLLVLPRHGVVDKANAIDQTPRLLRIRMMITPTKETPVEVEEEDGHVGHAKPRQNYE